MSGVTYIAGPNKELKQVSTMLVKEVESTTAKYVRPTGAPNTDTIADNAPDIEQGGVIYKPLYVLALMDTFLTSTAQKSVTGRTTGGDAFVFSDEPTTLYIGTTTHTFNTEYDIVTSESWKARYMIVYATAANKAVAAGITVNLYLYRATYEMVACTGTILSASSAIFGYSTVATNQNIKYINLENATFYNNAISVSYFCGYNYGLKSLILPENLTTISGSSFCHYCYSLTNLLLPSVATIGGTFCNFCHSLTSLSLPSVTIINGSEFCYYCYALTTLSLPSLVTVTAGNFCWYCTSLKALYVPALVTLYGSYFCYYCTQLKYISISTVTNLTGTNGATLNCCSFIELPTDFSITGVHFEGLAGYGKSYEWLNNELPTKLKDLSGSTSITIYLRAADIAMITAASAAIIAAKNVTISSVA